VASVTAVLGSASTGPAPENTRSGCGTFRDLGVSMVSRPPSRALPGRGSSMVFGAEFGVGQDELERLASPCDRGVIDEAEH
jgi:hypothetical protein